MADAIRASVSARLDRLPVTRTLRTLVVLLSLGGFFEFYDIFFSGYIAPGLVRSHILTPTTRGLFGLTGVASFVAALFSGLFIGTALFGFVADRFGRRTIFTFSLLWYTVASVVMAFQNDVFGLNLWRFIAGIGVGVELVTIDTYISELVPKHWRGRAFAINQTIQFCCVPVIALLAWRLVPISPFGLDGWRWVVLTGAAGAIVVWWIRRRVPESPRWLAHHGRVDEAERIVAELERRIVAETGAPLPAPGHLAEQRGRGGFKEIWRPPYLRRTIMMVVFNLFQTVGFYGFSNWVPTLLISRGIAVTSSLRYTFIIAIASPFGPLLAAALADKFERKWQIVFGAAGIAVSGVAFRADERGAAADCVWRVAYAFGEHTFVLEPRVSGRALPHAYPRAGCRVHLFLEPVIGGVQLVRDRFLSRSVRCAGSVRLHRRQYGDCDLVDRDSGPADEQSGSRNHIRIAEWHKIESCASGLSACHP